MWQNEREHKSEIAKVEDPQICKHCDGQTDQIEASPLRLYRDDLMNLNHLLQDKAFRVKVGQGQKIKRPRKKFGNEPRIVREVDIKANQKENGLAQ